MSDGTQDRKPQPESATPDSASQSPNRRSRAGVLGGWLLLIGTVLLFKAVIADHYLIPTDSMEPVLHGNPRFFRGDHVLVDKLAYGLRLPRTHRWLVRWRQPERGEIVVFFWSHDPARPVQIKRVAAVGGEEVRIEDGRLRINGREWALLDEEGRPIRYTDRLEPDEETICRTFLLLARENRLPSVLNLAHPPVEALRQAMASAHDAALLCDPDRPDLSQTCSGLCDALTPPVRNLLRHLILHQTPPPRYGLLESPVFTHVPEGACFLLGDNSAKSMDGRTWGFTPLDRVFGRAVLVWRPPFTFRLLTPSPLRSPGLILTLSAGGFLIAWFLFELTRKVRLKWRQMR